MYSIHSYGQMLADAPRMEAYVAALRRAVKPASVVLDLGCGPGVFALLACRFGARRVFAVEPDNVIQLAREAAIANGFEHRIEFFQKRSTEITLPERADVIISDLRGVLPWYQQHISSIVDARNRLLAPGGILIPRRDNLWAAVVEAPNRYHEIVGPWQSNSLDLSAATRVVTNTWRKTRIRSGELLVEPFNWATLDYYEIQSPDIGVEIQWTAARPGTAHGVAVWFDSELIDEIGFSNHPGAGELIYGNGLFPFSRPIQVGEGDRIRVALRADFIRNDYVWRWDTTVSSQNEKEISFKQSTLLGTPLSRAELHKRASSHVPVVNEEAEIAQFVLSQMNGKNSIEEIAALLSEHFPLRFRDVTEPLDLVADISEKYSA